MEGGVGLSVCPSVRLSVCPSVRPTSAVPRDDNAKQRVKRERRENRPK